MPPDAPTAPTSDTDAALLFELADVPRAATSAAPPGPRLCAQCGTENQRYARMCGA